MAPRGHARDLEGALLVAAHAWAGEHHFEGRLASRHGDQGSRHRLAAAGDDLAADGADKDFDRDVLVRREVDGAAVHRATLRDDQQPVGPGMQAGDLEAPVVAGGGGAFGLGSGRQRSAVLDSHEHQGSRVRSTVQQNAAGQPETVHELEVQRGVLHPGPDRHHAPSGPLVPGRGSHLPDPGREARNAVGGLGSQADGIRETPGLGRLRVYLDAPYLLRCQSPDPAREGRAAGKPQLDSLDLAGDEQVPGKVGPCEAAAITEEPVGAVGDSRETEGAVEAARPGVGLLLPPLDRSQEKGPIRPEHAALQDRSRFEDDLERRSFPVLRDFDPFHALGPVSAGLDLQAEDARLQITDPDFGAGEGRATPVGDPSFEGRPGFEPDLAQVDLARSGRDLDSFQSHRRETVAPALHQEDTGLHVLEADLAGRSRDGLEPCGAFLRQESRHGILAAQEAQLGPCHRLSVLVDQAAADHGPAAQALFTSRPPFPSDLAQKPERLRGQRENQQAGESQEDARSVHGPGSRTTCTCTVPPGVTVTFSWRVRKPSAWMLSS